MRPDGLAHARRMARSAREVRTHGAVPLTAAAICVVVIFAWVPLSLTAHPGVDPSWRAALQMAVHDRVRFGSGFAFTYGPLGFLDQGPLVYYGPLALLGLLYVLGLRTAGATVVLLALREPFGLLVASAIAIVDLTLLGALGGFPPAFGLLGAFVLWTLRKAPGERETNVRLGLAGAFTGLQLLMKFSDGLACVVILGLMTAGLPVRRPRAIVAALTVAVVSAAVTFVAGWLAAGQPLSALADYLRSAAAISTGYSAAMSIGLSGLDWMLPIALALLPFGAYGAWWMAATRPSRGRCTASLVWVALWFFAFKEGFVRLDPGHASTFIGAMLLVLPLLRWPRLNRTLVLTGLIGSSIALLVMLHQYAQPVTTPTTGVSAFAGDLRDILSPTRRDERERAGRALVRRTYPLSARELALVRGRPTTVYPTELDTVWAYRLRWRPLPVPQGYAAYTPWLDGLDARFLASDRAPERILLSLPVSIDERLGVFDQPQATRELLCRYRLIATGPVYAVLARRSSICRAPRLISTVRAAWGQTIAVPRPPHSGAIVFVRIGGVGVVGLESIAAALYEPAQRHVILDGIPYRLVAATAGDGLALRGGTGLDYFGQFHFLPQARTIAVTRAGAPSGRPVIYRFYSESYR